MRGVEYKNRKQSRLSCVADPQSLNQDPDPIFCDRKLNKLTVGKFFFLKNKCVFNIHDEPPDPREASSPQESTFRFSSKK